MFYGLLSSFAKVTTSMQMRPPLFMVSEHKDLFFSKAMPQWIGGIKTHLLGFFPAWPLSFVQPLIWSSNTRMGRYQKTLMSRQDKGYVRTMLED